MNSEEFQDAYIHITLSIAANRNAFNVFEHYAICTWLLILDIDMRTKSYKPAIPKFQFTADNFYPSPTMYE